MPSGPVRATVTGGTGFIGTHLVRALLSAGVRVDMWIRPGSEHRVPPGWRGAVTVRTVDLGDDRQVQLAMRDTRADALYHLSGTRGGTADFAVTPVEVNVLMTARILEHAPLGAIDRIVTVGSADEYGPQPGPQREDAVPRPVSPYGITRAAATQLALAYHAQRGCPVVVLRPFTVYGPGQPESMFLSQAVRAAVAGAPFEMTEGIQRRDFVHVADVVRALISAGHLPGVTGQVINVGSGQPSALRDVARLVWTLSVARGELHMGARKGAAGELHDTWADVTLARRLLGWKPTITLEAGLREMIAASRTADAPCLTE